MDRQISRLRLLGILFCLLGGVAITLGWIGTARVACVDCQVPYLLSGGAAGIALTVVGTGLLVIAQLRVEGRRIADRVAELAAAPPGAASSERDATRAASAGAVPPRERSGGPLQESADTAPLPPVGQSPTS